MLAECVEPPEYGEECGWTMGFLASDCPGPSVSRRQRVEQCDRLTQDDGLGMEEDVNVELED